MMPMMLPFPRNPFFVAGSHEPTLAHLFQPWPGRGKRLQVQALTGLCGIGKTQLANEYVSRRRHAYALILWLDASSREALRAGLRTITRQEQSSDHQLLAALHQRLQQQTNWLLVLDNLAELELLDALLPRAFLQGHGHVLLTTRLQATAGAAVAVPVAPLNREEGARFLLQRAGLLAPGASLRQADQQMARLARTLAQECAGLPLALDQAGAFLAERGGHLADLLTVLHEQPIRIWRARGQMRDPTHPASLAETLTQIVTRLSPPASDLLRLLAFAPPDLVVAPPLLRGGEVPLPRRVQRLATRPLAFYEVVAELQRFSLLCVQMPGGSLRMHPVVATICASILTPRQQQSFSALAQALWSEPAGSSERQRR